MKQGFESYHWDDEKGNPEGGVSIGKGFTISWQRGPLKVGEQQLISNGAFVEDVIGAIIDRMEYYQRGKFASDYNETAIMNLKDALKALQSRTKDRERRGVEGTHQK